MKVLVFGASGATGKLVVQQLIKKNIELRIVVRASSNFPNQLLNNEKVDVIKGNVDEFDLVTIKELINDCDAVVCCLGHNISFKGIFGPPYKLVYNIVRKITEAIQSLNPGIKFILMSTTAYTNKIIGETNSPGEKIVFSLLNIFLPPHRDNMLAADHLVYKSNINWAAVRPDSLIDENNVSEYELFEKKLRSPIFNPGKTSRINVSNFIAELVTDNNLWLQWKHKTPVIYNKE